MLMGRLCTRSCRFCAVDTGKQGEALRSDEGEAIAEAAREMALKYIVLTSVDRDDLADRGAHHFAHVINTLKNVPGIRVEALTPDYTHDELVPIAASAPDVLAHNIETVRSLQHIRDSRASFDKSLETLRAAKSLGIAVTKSSILLGLGEKKDEVLSAMDELREAGVDSLVLGQYLRPGKKQLPVVEYITPAEFEKYADEGLSRGFTRVVSSPFARTSYHAAGN
jgi:lipoic acid synthetase